MGDVILFRLRAAGSIRRRGGSVAQAGARIVFFTGVRYERMPESAAAPAKDAGDLGAPPAGGVGGVRRGKRRRGA